MLVLVITFFSSLCAHHHHHQHLIFFSSGFFSCTKLLDCIYEQRESVVEGNAESLAIVPKSESKLVIEQFLMQETFTR